MKQDKTKSNTIVADGTSKEHLLACQHEAPVFSSLLKLVTYLIQHLLCLSQNFKVFETKGFVLSVVIDFIGLHWSNYCIDTYIQSVINGNVKIRVLK